MLYYNTRTNYIGGLYYSCFVLSVSLDFFCIRLCLLRLNEIDKKKNV